MNNLKVLGEIIYERRLARGLTQQELADTTAIQRPYISDIEHGRRNVTVMILSRIAFALGMTLGQLFRAAEDRLSKKRIN